MLKIKKSNYFILIFILLNITLQSFACQDRAKGSSVKANMHTLQTMLETYAVDWGGIYPKDINELKKEAKKKDYWKDIKNPYNDNKKSYITLGKLDDKFLTSNLVKKNKYDVGSVCYMPFIEKNKRVLKYKIFGIFDKSRPIEKEDQTLLYLSDILNELEDSIGYLFYYYPCGKNYHDYFHLLKIDFIHEKGKIFYLTNS